MRVFVTGATGFIGSAIVKELIGAGHQVLGLARSDASAIMLVEAGAEVHNGTLEDLDSLRSGAADSDGVIHTAFIHDFSDISAAGKKDKLAVEVIGKALEGSDRPFVVTSGIAVLTPGAIRKEEDTPDLRSAGVHRIASEEATIALASRGVRSMVVRLPPSVHGTGDHGFVPALIGIARAKGVSAYIGDGLNRWPAVHRFDAANLYRLMLEKGIAGLNYHGVAEEGISTKEIAESIAQSLNIPLVYKSREEAPEHFGWLAHFFGTDCPASSVHTKETLGWKPTHPGLLEDLQNGNYF